MDWSNFLCNEPNLAWEGFIIVFLSGWEKQPTFLYSDSKKLEKHKLKIKNDHELKHRLDDKNNSFVS